MDLFERIVSAILVAVVVTDLTAAYLLLRGAVRSNYSIIALNERAFVAITQAISGILLALLGVNRLLDWHWDINIVLVMLSVGLILQATPGFLWVMLFVLGKFNAKGHLDPSLSNGKKEE